MKKIVCFLLSLLMLTASCAVLAEDAAVGGLVAHYDFEDPANLGKDVSGNGNDLVVKGKSTPAASADAAVGAGALALDGDCALVTEATVGDFTDSLVSYTVSFYAKHQGYVGEHSRVLSTGYNGCQCGMSLIVAKYTHEGTEHLVYQPIIGDRERDFWGRMNAVTTLLENLDAYHWYVCAFDAETNTMTAWIDGVLCGSVECAAPTVKCDPFGVALGGSYVPWDDNVMYGFIGQVDDLRIYDYAVEDASAIYSE